MWASSLDKNSAQKIMVLIFVSKDWRIKRCHNHWAHECDEKSKVLGCHYLQNARYDDKGVADPNVSEVGEDVKKKV
jgi:hypothetical protein